MLVILCSFCTTAVNKTSNQQIRYVLLCFNQVIWLDVNVSFKFHNYLLDKYKFVYNLLYICSMRPPNVMTRDSFLSQLSSNCLFVLAPKIPLLSERCCLGGPWFLPWTLDVYINSACHIWWIFMLPSQSSADFIFNDGKLFVYKLIQVFMALDSVPNHFPSQSIHWYINKSQSNNDQENCFKLTFHSSKYCCSYIQWYHCQLTLSNDNSVCCCDPITIENWKPQDDVLS